MTQTYYRPWFKEAATPIPKDVVLMIDTSSSMGNQFGKHRRIWVAREAGKTVLNTLNPNDRVSEFNTFQLFTQSHSIYVFDEHLTFFTSFYTCTLFHTLCLINVT